MTFKTTTKNTFKKDSKGNAYTKIPAVEIFLVALMIMCILSIVHIHNHTKHLIEAHNAVNNIDGYGK